MVAPAATASLALGVAVMAAAAGDVFALRARLHVAPTAPTSASAAIPPTTAMRPCDIRRRPAGDAARMADSEVSVWCCGSGSDAGATGGRVVLRRGGNSESVGNAVSH